MCVALSIYLICIGRAVLRDSQAFPADAVFDSDKIWVEQGDGFPEHVVRHLYDGAVVLDVINVTGLEIDANFEHNQRLLRLLRNGERLSLGVKDRKITGFEVGWMSAAKRITLGIALHPDRMGLHDWKALPGIGEKLAARIETDRHKNGDFVSLDGLKRVVGIGNTRIERWRKYF